MNNELVSVVIPSYNSAKYVCTAVESALRQTYAPLEVIVVDDGSTDDTRARLERFGGRVKYVYQPNRGLPGARNTGIRQAAGAWVALLDADDLWHPQKTAVQLAAVAAFPDAAAVGSPALQAMPPTLPPQAPVKRLEVRDFFLSTPVTSSSILVRRRCFDEVGLFHEPLTSVEDRDMWLRLVARYPVYQVTSPCFWVRQHEGQMSRNAQRMLANYRQVLQRFFDGHTAYRHLRRLAFGHMHLDIAHTFFEQGSSPQALWHLLQSSLWYQRAVYRRGPLFRCKTLMKFLLGERAFQRGKLICQPLVNWQHAFSWRASIWGTRPHHP